MRGFVGMDQVNAAGKFVLSSGDERVLDTRSLPYGVDWRNQDGVVRAVSSQGSCSADWAFSAVAAIESAFAIKHGRSINLSTQQCIDCATDSLGCRGGWHADCMSYAMHASLLEATNYAYQEFTGPCQALQQDQTRDDFASRIVHAKARDEAQVRVSQITVVPKHSVLQLMAAIAKQPVAVTVSSRSDAFMQYAGGIITDESCGTDVDHAALAVGYGSENGIDYFIVQNSWGADWGEHGYVRIGAVEGVGICGIQQVSIYPEFN